MTLSEPLKSHTSVYGLKDIEERSLVRDTRILSLVIFEMLLVGFRLYFVITSHLVKNSIKECGGHWQE